MTTKTKPKSRSIRIPVDLWEELKERYAKTYAVHRISSFNAWVVEQIRIGLRINNPTGANDA